MSYSRDNCIEHNLKGNKAGYANLLLRKGVYISAHRQAYCFARGVDPSMIKGSVVRHTCDNSRCINPRHLILGTVQDNVDDMMQRKRNCPSVGEANGFAKLTDVQVQEIKSKYVKGSKLYGSTMLAKEYGVSFGHIIRIIKGVCRNVQEATA